MSNFHGSMNEYLAVVKGSSDDISLTEHFKGKLIKNKSCLKSVFTYKYIIKLCIFAQVFNIAYQISTKNSI